MRDGLRLPAALVRLRVAEFGDFASYVLGRFARDRCPLYAATLTFTTLLTFVPMLAIALAILAQFPVFDDLSANLEEMVLTHFTPAAGTALLDHLARFTENVGELSAYATVGLALGVILLLRSIENACNDIWHVREPRPFMWRVLAFWTVLTLGPILLGISITLSGYLFATAKAGGLEAWTGPGGAGTRFLPPLLEFAAFSLLYGAIPNRPVRLHHALTGALVATLLFELLKTLFGLYLTYLPTYQTVYGAMAVLPVTLVWVYLAWTAALLGAVIAASLGDWKGHRATAAIPRLAPGIRLTVALAILAEMLAVQGLGRVIRRRTLLTRLDMSAFVVEDVLANLVQARYVARAGRHRWVLARDLSAVTLHDLYTDLNLGIVDGALGWLRPSPWSRRVSEVLSRFHRLGAASLAIPLNQLLADDRAAGAAVVAFPRGGEPGPAASTATLTDPGTARWSEAGGKPAPHPPS
ncbi:MAG: YihY family inner membrane protein [Rhodospirillales bacterium]|nr:MAG: YihY family inner membrane protein [Rhodospirillales bacterium]